MNALASWCYWSYRLSSPAVRGFIDARRERAEGLSGHQQERPGSGRIGSQSFIGGTSTSSPGTALGHRARQWESCSGQACHHVLQQLAVVAPTTKSLAAPRELGSQDEYKGAGNEPGRARSETRRSTSWSQKKFPWSPSTGSHRSSGSP